ncbi:hypothetical protein [Tenacibaculum maritimum]|nr:hypothetical protein [Tenacibaculum maritimum]MCD9562273.1 hypothetical protein [Tenacibaculum maritimum]MCD9565828.1 hypothetical protein [Tenacibaculum maritimum]MCD9577973.1 hypothetical protein [Tenacibaculum maritimum]MCD9582858.1 hypothetical protein [Tenacibaculum maritimum]MCD9585957.1 hypothetical protein [Tenacibaculum maritimum]
MSKIGGKITKIRWMSDEKILTALALLEIKIKLGVKYIFFRGGNSNI